MTARFITAALMVGMFLLLAGTEVQGGAKLIKEYQGQAPAKNFEKALPPTLYLPGPTALKKFWDATELKEPMPKVDFEKELVIYAYSLEAKDLKLQYKLNDKGNLNVFSTAKKGDDIKIMSFHLAIVSRENVKTVNGKKIVIKE